MSSPGLEQELRNERRVEVWGSWFIGLTLIVSALAHVAALWSMPQTARPRERSLALDVKMKFEDLKPDPEPEPEPEPEPPPLPLTPPPKPKVPLPPPPNDDTPAPPPTAEPPPEVVVGATAASVTETGAGPAIQVGNTLYGQTAPTAVDPATVRPITGPTAPPGPPAPVVTRPSVKSEWTDGAYPEEARENNIEGVVQLEITISPEGVVTHVVVVKGLGFGLDEEAKRRIRRFRFNPATRDGVPVSATVPMSVRFALTD
ncbi:MAG: energy transducer TonB [Myxococcales bacterium]|nr:energy transducer TonB [Myxococcales bacterium]